MVKAIIPVTKGHLTWHCRIMHEPYLTFTQSLLRMTSEIADLLLLLRAAQRSLRNYFHVSLLELWLIFFEPVANGILAGCSLGWIRWKMNPSSIMYIVPMEALEFDSECWAQTRWFGKVGIFGRISAWSHRLVMHNYCMCDEVWRVRHTLWHDQKLETCKSWSTTQSDN